MTADGLAFLEPPVIGTKAPVKGKRRLRCLIRSTVEPGGGIIGACQSPYQPEKPLMKLADNLCRHNAEPMPVAENTIEFLNCFRLSIQMNVLNCVAGHNARKNSILERQFTNIRKHKKTVTPYFSLSFKQSDFREINANAILMFFRVGKVLAMCDCTTGSIQKVLARMKPLPLVKVRDRLIPPI